MLEADYGKLIQNVTVKLQVTLQNSNELSISLLLAVKLLAHIVKLIQKVTILK